MYEVMEYTDVRPSIDNPNPTPLERSIGVFEVEQDAVEAGRAVRTEFIESERPDYTWWTVRQPGSRLANWIADSHSPKEFMLDLTTGELVEME